MKATFSPLFFALLLTFSAPFLFAQNSAAVERLLQKSRAGFRAADYPATRAAADSVLFLTQSAAARTEAWTLKGRAAFMLDQYAQAEVFFQQARSLARSVLPPSDRLSIEAQVFAAWNLYYWGKIGPALSLVDSVLAWEPMTLPSEAMAYAHELRGVHQGDLHIMPEALPHFFQALAVRQSLAAQDSLQLYQTYKWLAIAYTTLGDFEKATLWADRSLALIGRHGGNSFQKSVIYLRLGFVHHFRGDAPRALEYMQQSHEQLSLLSKTGPIAQATISSALALCSAAVGDTLGADSLYAKAIRLSEQSPFPSPIPLCNELNNYSIYLKNRGKPEQAIAQIRRAVTLALPMLDSIPDAPYTLSFLYNQLLIWHYAAGRLDAAQMVFDTVSTLLKPRLGARNPALAQVYTNYASVLSGQGLRAEAIALSDTCLLMFHATDADSFDTWLDPVPASYALWNRSEEHSRIFQETGDSAHLRLAWQGFDRYVQFLDYLRGSYRDEGSKIGLADENRVAYEYALTMLFASDGGHRHFPMRQKAFEYITKSSGLVLSEAVNRSGVLEDKKALPAQWSLREKALRQSVVAAEKERLSTQRNSNAPNTLLSKVERKLSQRKQVFYQFLDSLKTARPSYYAQRYAPTEPSLTDLQQVLKAEKQGFVTYFLGSESVFGFWATADTSVVFQVPSDSVAAWVEQMKNGLSQVSRSIPKQTRLSADYRHAAHQLYRRLFGPIEPLLTERFVVAPDDKLCYVPFPALLRRATAESNPDFRQLDYLRNRHRISYAYSAGLMLSMRQKKHEPEKEILVMAPFALSGTTEADVLRHLPFSKTEAQGVARLYGTAPLLDQAANKDLLLKTAGQYRQLYLATHGSAGAGYDAWVALAVAGSKPLRSVRLTVREIYLLTLHADLVTLSACETGLGTLQNGEGVLSMARAFAYAGAKSIAYSLWSVDDKSTGELMQGFHRYLKAGKPKDEALWLAQGDFLKNCPLSQSANPHFWAGFVLVGE